MSVLDHYLARIEEELSLAIERLGQPCTLRDACTYSLNSGGKRLRPILVLMIADSLGKKRDVMQAALSVEFFHTASLIADDLPCMDNDDFRRNKPSLHKAFGESIALLASYTLIAAGYGGIYETSRTLKARFPEQTAEINAIAVRCLEIVTDCAGLKGATSGQFLDLFPPDASYETLRTITLQKTATLFEISFVLGWLFGGGDASRLHEVQQCAHHLGLSFQIADDLIDLEQDDSPKNLACALGAEVARQLFEQEFSSFIASLQRLGLWSESFQQLSSLLAHRIPNVVCNKVSTC